MRFSPPNVTRGTLVAAAVAAGLMGCSDRERPTGPNPGGPIAVPLITINTPGSDTTVSSGDQILVSGVISDDNGVDSIYIDIAGGTFNFPPSAVAGLVVQFAFNVPTAGLGGTNLQVTVTAVDIDGNLSSPTRRTLSVQ